MVRAKSNSSSLQGERRVRLASGVFAIPLAVAAAYDVIVAGVANDEYAGLDRLDREELDETDEDVRPRGAVRVNVPATYRRSA